MGGVAEDVAGGVGGDGVAAFEDAQGAALFELQAQAVEAFAFCAKQAFGAGGQFVVAFFELAMQSCNLWENQRTTDAGAGSSGDGGLVPSSRGAQVRSEREVVRALAKFGDLQTEIKRHDAQVRGGETLAGVLEVGVQAVSEAGGHFVGALALLAEQIEGAAEAATTGQLVDAAA